MQQEIIYQVKDITVFQQVHLHSLPEANYLIRKGDDEFTTWDKPPLNYESLRKQILEYKNDKEMEIAADVENEDRREDEESFWELDTEGF